MSWNPAALPPVLVLTEDAICHSHGTGACLLRILEGVPEDRLANGYRRVRGEAVWRQSHSLETSEGMLALRNWLSANEKAWVYSGMFTRRGLDLVRELMEALPNPPPLIHHAFDLVYEDEMDFAEGIRALLPWAREYWGGEAAASDKLSEWTGRTSPVMNPLCAQVPRFTAREYRERPSEIVMLGNVHLKNCWQRFLEEWRVIRSVYDLPAIKWFAHPSTFEARRREITSDDIVHRGFLSTQDLHEALLNADVGLVLFNTFDKPENTYARFSIPSRMTEYAFAGLPIFMAAGRETDAYRFACQNGLAVAATLDEGPAFRAKFIAFLKDRALRRRTGERARSWAERFWDIGTYRTRMLERLSNLGVST